jgi:hypothetical protein
LRGHFHSALDCWAGSIALGPSLFGPNLTRKTLAHKMRIEQVVSRFSLAIAPRPMLETARQAAAMRVALGV